MQCYPNQTKNAFDLAKQANRKKKQAVLVDWLAKPFKWNNYFAKLLV